MKTWIKKHTTVANLFFALAWAYAIAGALYLGLAGFDWWTLADVMAYSTLIWLIGCSYKQEANYKQEIQAITERNNAMKMQLRMREGKV